MNLPSLISDNITEILIKITEFTHTRQKILTQNINNIHKPNFVPKDLTVNEFSDSLKNAIDEHIRNKRLMLCDTENIRFGINGSFEAKPMVDEDAKNLLKENPNKYLKLQINKLIENTLNQRIAVELLRQKEEAISISDY